MAPDVGTYSLSARSRHQPWFRSGADENFARAERVRQGTREAADFPGWGWRGVEEHIDLNGPTFDVGAPEPLTPEAWHSAMDAVRSKRDEVLAPGWMQVVTVDDEETPK